VIASRRSPAVAMESARSMLSTTRRPQRNSERAGRRQRPLPTVRADERTQRDQRTGSRIDKGGKHGESNRVGRQATRRFGRRGGTAPALPVLFQRASEHSRGNCGRTCQFCGGAWFRVAGT